MIHIADDNTSGLYWCATESNLFTVVACMPAMPAILHKVFRRVRDVSNYGSRDQYRNYGPGNGSYLRRNSDWHPKSSSHHIGVICKATEVDICRTERSNSDVELVEHPSVC